MPTQTSTAKLPGQKCICQICTCGRHRCPHRPGTTSLRQSGPVGRMGTEYKDRFVGDNAAVRQPRRRHPDSLVLATDPMEAVTSNRSDYVSHGVVPRQHALADGSLLRPEGDMDLRTSYNAQFDGKPMERSRIAKPVDGLGNSGDFDGMATYKDDYRKWDVQRPAKSFEVAPLQSEQEPFVALSSHQADFQGRDGSQKTRALRPKTATKIGGDFFHNTTSRDAFKGLQGERRPNMKPEVAAEALPPFEAMTTGQDYQPWASKRPQKRDQATTIGFNGHPAEMTTTNLAEYVSKANAERAVPLRPRTATKIPGDAFDGSTTQRSDYGPQAATVTRMHRPPTNTGLGGGNFLGESTSNASYQPWPSQRPEMRRPRDGALSDGDMQLATTNRSDYGDPAGVGRRASNLRPSTMQKVSSDAFQEDTTSRRDFQGRQVTTPVGRIIHRQEYRPPTGPFEGSTTNKSDYVPVEGVRARAVRRSGANPFGTDNGLPVDGVSSYRSDYAHRDAEPCPAEGLVGDGVGNEKFRFRTQVGGHHFYVSQPIIV